MKKLFIIGAGGFGREVLGYAIDVLDHAKSKGHTVDWDIAGFLDDNPSALSLYNCASNIIGPIHGHIVNQENVYICAIADVRIKKKVCESMFNRGACFVNLVHPTARVGSTSKLGIGVILAPLSQVTEDVVIGNHVILNLYSSCGHDASIGDYCTISAHCDITGFVQLEEGVFLGSHAVIIPGCKIGAFARLGAGSVILKNVETESTVFGNPAKKVF